MIWAPDTCHCEIKCIDPATNGIFLKRCRIHNTSRNTVEVYQHNLTNRTRGSELTGTGKNRRQTEQGEKRKHDLRESTR